MYAGPFSLSNRPQHRVFKQFRRCCQISTRIPALGMQTGLLTRGPSLQARTQAPLPNLLRHNLFAAQHSCCRGPPHQRQPQHARCREPPTARYTATAATDASRHRCSCLRLRAGRHPEDGANSGNEGVRLEDRPVGAVSQRCHLHTDQNRRLRVVWLLQRKNRSLEAFHTNFWRTLSATLGPSKAARRARSSSRAPPAEARKQPQSSLC